MNISGLSFTFDEQSLTTPRSLDMDLPILDILSQARAANQLSSDIDLCDRGQWKEDIELYAPGYLAFEEAGRGAEYDLTRLAAPNEIAGAKKRVWQKLRTGQVPGFTYLANGVQPGPQFGSAPMEYRECSRNWLVNMLKGGRLLL